jgi:hypothetical protein
MAFLLMASASVVFVDKILFADQHPDKRCNDIVTITKLKEPFQFTDFTVRNRYSATCRATMCHLIA